MAPSRLDFTVEHDSLKIEVRLFCLLEGQVFEFPSLGTGIANMFLKKSIILSGRAVGKNAIWYYILTHGVLIVESWIPS